jgi:hypothetical protein
MNSLGLYILMAFQGAFVIFGEGVWNLGWVSSGVK